MCSGPQQFFRVRPSDADVAQGGTAIVECEIANRQGKVQWTKDGLTLGRMIGTFISLVKKNSDRE